MPYIEKNNILEIPLSTCPKHPFTVFDTWHSLRAKRLTHRIKHRTPEQYIALFEKLIKIGIETNPYINIYIDPDDVRRIENFTFILEKILRSSNDLSVVTYKELISRDFSELL